MGDDEEALRLPPRFVAEECPEVSVSDTYMSVLPRPRTSMESLFTGGPGLGFGFIPQPMSQPLAGDLPSPLAFGHLDSPPALGPFGMIDQQAAHMQVQTAPSSDVNKPADDGYKWRKYGQYPTASKERSYYMCTHLDCPVKKRVEQSVEGHAIVTMYIGEHNHERPQPKNRAKDAENIPGNPELCSQVQSGNLKELNEHTVLSSIAKIDEELSHITQEQLLGTSDGEDKPTNATRRESRISVQVPSEVDVLDDGYRWRKYGKRPIAGRPYPRHYYKCKAPGCNVRKTIERSSSNWNDVITTYIGKHNHHVPAGTDPGNKSSQQPYV